MKYLLFALLVSHAGIAASPQNFLWVVRNSSLDSDTRYHLASEFPRFQAALRRAGVTKYEMAVVSTDFFTEGGQVLGRISSDGYPREAFARTMASIEVDTATGFWPQGLESVYQAIVKYGALVQKGVPLNLIVVSGKDDYSCESHCYGVEPEHNPDYKPFSLDRYVALFQRLEKNHGVKVRLFPLVGSAESKCEVTTFGARYLALQKLLGQTVSGSVCKNQIMDDLDRVAAALAD